MTPEAYIALGFFSCCLLFLFVFGAVCAARDRKHTRRSEMRTIAYEVVNEKKNDLRPWHIKGLEDKVIEIIEEYLAEREQADEEA